MDSRKSTPPLRVLFDSLSQLESREEREAFLDFTCRDDPGLRDRLERLLALRHDAREFFEMQPAPMASSDEADDQDGDTRIGRYRLLGRLGEGGCGVVYLAEQQEPVKRRVALKIIRLGMDTENVIARFEMERQALAMMDHPNIARVLDVGATTSGRPYFVMQLVDGEKITDYCDAKRLGIRERLMFFIRICHAVQHAHQKGVIHRDIKPSNILVWEHDGEAVPKVIDFGIAKATNAGLDGRATFTSDGQFVGTPAYMSPEQAAGTALDIDTRTDIYSLGALLYELLSGQPPFDPVELRQLGAEEIRSILGEREPAAPSVALGLLSEDVRAEVAARRGCEIQKLSGQIRDDLDRIVMKAMAKDRQHRYSGADALAADVLCFLNDEPVSARPPGGFYRFGKLVRRNRAAFAAGVVVFASLVLGLGAATAMYFRANRAREAAELARANEAALRQQAEIGQNIARAAVLVRYQKFAEADELLSGIGPADIEPSLESAEVSRALGLWHAREGRWKEAANRFAALAFSMASADSTDSENISIDIQPAASTLCAAGDLEGYEKLRRMAVARFGGSSNPIVAEQVVKPCLLVPAETEVLEGLAHLEEVMLTHHETHAPATDFERNLASWREFAIALIEYRKGNFERGYEWIEQCTCGTHENPARAAIAWALRSMLRHRLGHPDVARQDLAAARFIVAEAMTEDGGIFAHNEPAWQDWLNAQGMIREAEALLNSSDRDPP